MSQLVISGIYSALSLRNYPFLIQTVVSPQIRIRFKSEYVTMQCLASDFFLKDHFSICLTDHYWWAALYSLIMNSFSNFLKIRNKMQSNNVPFWKPIIKTVWLVIYIFLFQRFFFFSFKDLLQLHIWCSGHWWGIFHKLKLNFGQNDGKTGKNYSGKNFDFLVWIWSTISW